MPDFGPIPAFSRPKVDDSLGKLVAKGHEDEPRRGNTTSRSGSGRWNHEDMSIVWYWEICVEICSNTATGGGIAEVSVDV